MKFDALFLAAHPDDVELFCGATVAKLALAGAGIGFVDLTAGEKASNGSVEGRRKASIAASRILGARGDRAMLGLPDAGLNGEDAAQLACLVDFLGGNPSRLLFAPWPEDRHGDHVAAGELAKKALSHPDLDGRRPERLVFYAAHHDAPEHIYVDVTEQMQLWRDAVACYEDQFVAAPGTTPTPINDPGFLPSQEERRRAWGRRAGCEYAEAFALEAAPVAFTPLALLGERAP
jgi:bacillithiol biosynthesis deacetylase BshB1